MDDVIVVEDCDQQCFDLGCLQIAFFIFIYFLIIFFGRGEVGEHHAINCRFDSGSNW